MRASTNASERMNPFTYICIYMYIHTRICALKPEHNALNVRHTNRNFSHRLPELWAQADASRKTPIPCPRSLRAMPSLRGRGRFCCRSSRRRDPAYVPRREVLFDVRAALGDGCQRQLSPFGRSPNCSLSSRTGSLLNIQRNSWIFGARGHFWNRQRRSATSARRPRTVENQQWARSQPRRLRHCSAPPPPPLPLPQLLRKTTRSAVRTLLWGSARRRSWRSSSPS